MTAPYGSPRGAAPLDIQADRGPGGKAPPPPGVPMELQRSLQLYLPEVFPIPGATEFYRDEIVTVAVAGSFLPAALITQLPQNSLGIIRVYGVGVDDMTNATRLVFRLRVNQMPVPAWGAFRIFPGVAARATSSTDVWVVVPNAALIDVQIDNVDGASYQVGVNYSGWWWPESMDRLWRGELWKMLGRGA